MFITGLLFAGKLQRRARRRALNVGEMAETGVFDLDNDQDERPRGRLGIVRPV